MKATLHLNKKDMDDDADIWHNELADLCKEFIAKYKPTITED